MYLSHIPEAWFKRIQNRMMKALTMSAKKHINLITFELVINYKDTGLLFWPHFVLALHDTRVCPRCCFTLFIWMHCLVFCDTNMNQLEETFKTCILSKWFSHLRTCAIQTHLKLCGSNLYLYITHIMKLCILILYIYSRKKKRNKSTVCISLWISSQIICQ